MIITATKIFIFLENNQLCLTEEQVKKLEVKKTGTLRTCFLVSLLRMPNFWNTVRPYLYIHSTITPPPLGGPCMVFTRYVTAAEGVFFFSLSSPFFLHLVPGDGPAVGISYGQPTQTHLREKDQRGYSKMIIEVKEKKKEMLTI